MFKILLYSHKSNQINYSLAHTKIIFEIIPLLKFELNKIIIDNKFKTLNTILIISNYKIYIIII